MLPIQNLHHVGLGQLVSALAQRMPLTDNLGRSTSIKRTPKIQADPWLPGSSTSSLLMPLRHSVGLKRAEQQ